MNKKNLYRFSAAYLPPFMSHSPDPEIRLKGLGTSSRSWKSSAAFSAAKLRKEIHHSANLAEVVHFIADGHNRFVVYILDNLPLCDPETLSQLEAQHGATFDAEKVIDNVGQNYMKYYLCYIFAKNCCTPEMKKRGEADIAELKEAFRERIAANTWLSDASKANVLDKLNAMAVNVSEPDWLAEGLINLSQTKSFFEDVMEVRKTYFNLIKKLYGMNVQQGSFHSLAAFITTITEVNSVYAPNFNSMNIFPAFLMEPLYSEKSSTAVRYAAMTVFGHEMTHGFDTKGAEWDKLGDMNSILASDADAV